MTSINSEIANYFRDISQVKSHVNGVEDGSVIDNKPDQVSKIEKNSSDKSLITRFVSSKSKLEFNISNLSTQPFATLEAENEFENGTYLRISVNGQGVDIYARSRENMKKGTPELNFNIDEIKFFQSFKGIMSIIEDIQNYNPESLINEDVDKLLEAKEILSALKFEGGYESIKITSKSSSSYNNDIYISTDDHNRNGFTLDGKSINDGSHYLDGGEDKDLHAGTFATFAQKAYEGTATTIARGSRGDEIITEINPTAASAGSGNATGVSSAGISNNPEFVGKIEGFKARFVMDDRVNIGIEVGNYIYSARNIDTTPKAKTIVRLSSENGGGYFDLQFENAENSGQKPVSNQEEANEFAKRLDKALANVSFFQHRKIKDQSVDEMSKYIDPLNKFNSTPHIPYPPELFLINDNFSDIYVENVSVTPPRQNNSNAEIQITLNGEIYKSGYNNAGIAVDLGNKIHGGASIGLVNVNNPKSLIYLNNGGTPIELENSEQAKDFENYLNKYFNLEKPQERIKNDKFLLSYNKSQKIEVKESPAKELSLTL